jgi:DNA invertase Pin-like site-specific DNA recombinase
MFNVDLKKPPVSKPRAFGYGRASHLENSFGDSIPGQQARVREYFDRKLADEYEWGDWAADEVTSAYKIPFPKRDSGRWLLRIMRAGDVLIIDKVDRIWRSTADFVRVLETLDGMGVRVIFADQDYLDPRTPHGKLMLTMMVAVAEWDSHFKSLRIKEALARSRASGVTGANAYRWQIGISLQPIRHPLYQGKTVHIPIWWPECRAIMDRIVRLRDDHAMGWVQIAKQIEADMQEYRRNHSHPIGRTVRWAKKNVKCKSIAPIPRPFTTPDAKKFYTFEKEIRFYGITDPRDWNRTDHKRLTLEQAEQVLGDIPMPEEDE